MIGSNDEYWKKMVKALKDHDHNVESREEAEKRGKEYHTKEHKAFKR